MFDRMLVSKRGGVDRRKVRQIGVSTALHLAAIALFLLASVWVMEKVADVRTIPDLIVDFIPTPTIDAPPPPKPKVEIAKPLPEPPKPEPITPPKPELKVEPPKIVQIRPLTPEPEVTIPEAKLKQTKQDLSVAKLDAALRARQEAPDVLISSRTPGKSGRPELALTAQQLKGAPGVTGSLDTPDVAIGGVAGGKSRSVSGAPKLAAESHSYSKTTLYGGQGSGDPDVVIPAGGPGGKGGGAPAGRPGAALTAGGLGGSGSSIRYSAGPPDAPIGDGVTGAASRGTPSRLDSVRAALANKYGLPLVSVNEMGQRSTDARRWNLLLPELTELLKKSMALPNWNGGASGVTSITRDGRTLMIRYSDGIVHVLTLDDGGLAALFVARPGGARAVDSKIAEAENARSALYAYLRGAS